MTDTDRQELIVLAAVAYLNAIDARREFESENPNNTTKRWAAKLYAEEAAEEVLRAAISKSP